MVENYPEVFSKVEIKRVEKLNNKHSKVYYTKGSSNFEAIVNSDRKDLLLIANCEEIAVKKLPAIVYDSFRQSEYGNYKIQKAFIVRIPYSSEFYRLDINEGNKDGHSYKSIFFTDTGQYRTPPY